jgi:bifunctional non-homologous end joining protein LigD
MRDHESLPICAPQESTKVPSAAEWFHEVKHDGFRLMVTRDGNDVRLLTKGGHNWIKRYPWIAETALRIRTKQFVLDGEAVLLGVDGTSDFDGLQSRKYDHEVRFYAFDVLAADGEDYRKLPLSMRKVNLERILARRANGSSSHRSSRVRSARILFRHACLMGLEDLVSKHSQRWFGAGPCDQWIKTKNPKHPAYRRVTNFERRSFCGVAYACVPVDCPALGRH